MKTLIQVAGTMFAAAVVAVLALAVHSADTIQPGEVVARTKPYLPRPPLTFRAETRLVEVPVVVRDSSGKPVEGLERDDFEILDNGKKRPVAAFSVQRFTPAATRSGQPEEAARPGQPSRQRYVGLVFDDLNTGFAEFRAAQEAAEGFVREGLAAEDRVAIFTITRAQVLPFTSDSRLLAETIRRLSFHQRPPDKGGCPELTPYEAYLIVHNVDPQTFEVKVEETRRCLNLPPDMSRGRGGLTPSRTSPDAVVRTVMARAVSIWEHTRTVSQATLGTLRNIVDYMATLPGTRVLVLASAGFLAATLEREQEDIVARALRTGVIIHCLDAKGLYVTPMPEMPRGGDSRSLINQQLLGTRPLRAANDALAYLAYGSGGRLFENSNDLAGGFRRLAAVPEVSYVLGFVPEGRPDGKFHRLAVRLSRAKGLQVEARPGYYATAEATTPQAGDRRRIDEEVFSDNRTDQLPVGFVWEVEREESNRPVFVGRLRFEVDKLGLDKKGETHRGQLRFVAALLAEDGTFAGGAEGVIDFALREASFKKLSAQGLVVRFRIESAPGRYVLRVVVHDPARDRLSCWSQPVEIALASG